MLVPITVAVKACVWPTFTVAVDGEIETLTFCVMVIVAEADLEVSAADVAVIVTVVPCAGTAAGAV